MRIAGRELQTLFGVGTLGGVPDERLLERFAAHREEAAFEALVRRHGPMVWGVCRRILRDHHDAEDAFQATFLVLARKGHAIAHRELVANWIYGVAYQTARKARSTRDRRRMREGQVTDMPEPEAVSLDVPDDLTEWLDRELSRLPDRYRMPIVLCELEGKSHREAAEQLGWPIGTVSGRLSRARAMLARRLSRRGASLSLGSLAVLLARESASASVPTQLIGSTARAATLVAAGGAVTAGAVPAEVAALTGEVMKVMLLGKLKIATAMLLVASALAAGGTGLAYRAQATEQGRKEDLQRLIDEKKEELQRLIDRQKGEDPRTEGRDQRSTIPTLPATDPPDRQRPRDAQYTLQPDTPAPRRPGHLPAPAADQAPRPETRPPDLPAPATNNPIRQDSIAANQPQDVLLPRRQDQRTGDSLSDLILAGAHTPGQLAHAKQVIDAMIDFEKEVQGKSPEELDKMIEEGYWQVRLLEARLRRLKEIRGATRTDRRAR